MEHVSIIIGGLVGTERSLLTPQPSRLPVSENCCAEHFDESKLVEMDSLYAAVEESEMSRRAISENIADKTVNRIEATHREISGKRLRELESLAKQVADSRKCQCPELDKVLERFESFRDALLPWLIREQYLLLPAVKQRLAARLSGLDYLESYQGEFADMVRTAEGDHNQLNMLASDLDRDMTVLAEKGFCSTTVRTFVEVLGGLVSCLAFQIQLEHAILLSCFDQNRAEK
ncbi:MAG: hypothetical protein IPP40_13040 [bacterium]|nr:hypothetical protein [bacterium]